MEPKIQHVFVETVRLGEVKSAKHVLKITIIVNTHVQYA
jgi:hypothetical protein